MPNFPPMLANQEVSIGEIKKYVQVVLTDSSRSPSKKNLAILEGGRQWKVNDQKTKLQIILAGMGWGRLPEHMIQNELKRGILVPLKIKNFPTSIEGQILVVRRVGQPIGPVASKLWEYFQQFSKKTTKIIRLERALGQLP